MQRFVLFVAVLFGVAACNTPEPNADDRVAPDAETSGVERPSADVMRQMAGQAAGDGEHHGAELFAVHCSVCHDGTVPRAPHTSFLQMLSPDMLMLSMTDGVMKQEAAALSGEQKADVVEFLTGGRGERAPVELAMCDAESMAFAFDEPPVLRNWGHTLENTRFIPAEVARLPAADVPRLELKWAFAVPYANRVRSQPAVAGGALFFGSADGTVYSIERQSGCVRWTFRASAEVRTGITLSTWEAGDTNARPIAYFGDLLARVYAIDLLSGELLWSTKVDEHPNATATAQPVLHDGRVYQTVSSLEVVPAADPDYPCCSFRGSVVALDAGTGEIAWKSYTIEEEPSEVARTSHGTPILAPSGAPSWNSPLIDPARGQLYIGTGSNYSSPAEGSSDAIIAFALADGEIRWKRQTTEGDAWNLACMPFIPNQANCPDEDGPDVDYGAPPLLVRDGDDELLVAGQKSGMVYGIEPDTGELRWSLRVGRGGNQGGVHFGMAADGRRVFVPISDYDDDMLPVEDARPGIYAVDGLTGELLWSTPAEDICAGRENCDPGISQAISAIPGVVFAGHMDGRFRAYSADTGEVLWEIDTHQEFPALHGLAGHGGSFGGGAGPVVHDGVVYASSGYGLYFHMPGNLLMAFHVPKAVNAAEVSP